MDTLLELARRTLFRVKQTDYGKSYHDDLLTEYERCCESLERTAEARRSNDRYFLAINTLLLTSYISLAQAKLFVNNGHWTVFVSCVGLVICAIWNAVTVWHMQHHRIQRLVARMIETRLPVRPLTTEDKMMRGEHPFMSRHSAWLRYSTPWIFVLLYMALPFLL
ncbi:MAG: hypothetical protein HY422_00065 [Candidatus Komeilibacteria bacterium]|nr:hypothetical protein [Candidatus Komeilibacteria bacterium]